MAAAHSRPDYHCPFLPYCGFRGQLLVERRMEGRQEEHQEWQQREQVIPCLRRMVKQALGAGWRVSSSSWKVECLVFRLFKREAVVSTAKLLDSSVDADKPGAIMTRLQAEVLQEKKREDLRPLLYRVVGRALSDRAVTPALVSQLLRLIQKEAKLSYLGLIQSLLGQIQS